MDKKELEKNIDELIWFLLTTRDREKQTFLELNIYEYWKLIKDKREFYFSKKIPLDRKKNDDFGKIRELHNSDLATTKAINKGYAQEITDLEAFEAEIEIMTDFYKVIIKVANHINDRFIQDNVDNKRNVH